MVALTFTWYWVSKRQTYFTLCVIIKMHWISCLILNFIGGLNILTFVTMWFVTLRSVMKFSCSTSFLLNSALIFWTRLLCPGCFSIFIPCWTCCHCQMNEHQNHFSSMSHSSILFSKSSGSIDSRWQNIRIKLMSL